VPEFLANGYARTSMERVAKVAGVSKQTLYSHFSDEVMPMEAERMIESLINLIVQKR
jgi:AcrR family transcriptional regulator